MISKEIIESLNHALQTHSTGSNIHEMNALRHRLLGYYAAYCEAANDQKVCEEKCHAAIKEAIELLYKKGLK